MSRQIGAEPDIVNHELAWDQPPLDEETMNPGSATAPPLEPIARQDGVALWRQISNRLQQDIASGARSPGSRLPTEA